MRALFKSFIEHISCQRILFYKNVQIFCGSRREPVQSFCALGSGGCSFLFGGLSQLKMQGISHADG